MGRLYQHDRFCVNSDADETLALWESSYVSEVMHHSCRKSEMLKKEIRKVNEIQSEIFIYPGASLQKHFTLVTLQDNGRGNGVTCLAHKKDI